MALVSLPLLELLRLLCQQMHLPAPTYYTITSGTNMMMIIIEVNIKVYESQGKLVTPQSISQQLFHVTTIGCHPNN